MSDNNSIGAFIAALRKAKGLTQKQLAEKLNVSDKAVSRWERDECAPDLSIIPVLAEIFEITSDELLRGRRSAPDTVPSPQAEERSKRRLQYLLDKLKTRYQIQSIVSVGIAVVGVIAAMILNAYHRAQAGFLVGCVFFLAASICQIIFLTLGKAELRSEEFDEDAVTACRNTIIKGAEWVLCIIAFLLFATAPLLLADDPYWGVTVPYWWTTGLAFVLIPMVACPIICCIINYKLGVFGPMGPKGKLRLKTVAVVAVILVGTILLHLLAANILYEYRYLYSPCAKFDNFADFKAHMETPLNPGGEPLTLIAAEPHADGTKTYHYEDPIGVTYHVYYTEYILDDPDTGFYPANLAVQDICHAGSSYYTFDLVQYGQAATRFNRINGLLALIYPAEILAAVLICRKKEKHLA